MKLLSYDAISYDAIKLCAISYEAINYKLYKAMGKYTEIRQKINSALKGQRKGQRYYD